MPRTDPDMEGEKRYRTAYLWLKHHPDAKAREIKDAIETYAAFFAIPTFEMGNYFEAANRSVESGIEL